MISDAKLQKEARQPSRVAAALWAAQGLASSLDHRRGPQGRGYRIWSAHANLKSTIRNLKSEIPHPGRIAPSPTGYLHLGHALIFWRAQERAQRSGGKLVLRIEDLDNDRCAAEFRDAIVEDLHWFGLRWDEGPDIGGAFAPYVQSQRREIYLAEWKKLRDAALIYACICSRRDILQSANAPHHENEEPVYPGTCRPKNGATSDLASLRGITGAFACRTGKRCSSSIGGLERNSRLPAWISAISSSGEKTMCRLINSRSWRVTQRCKLVK